MKAPLRFVLLFLLSIIVCLCVVPAAFAEGEHFTIPKDTTAIGDEAFSNCTKMTSVTIPATVKSIGHSAFSGCINLKRIYFDGTQTQWDNIRIAANNDLLSISRCVFLAEKPATTRIRVGDNDYTASFLGRMDMSSWSETYRCRDFWRLEDAYDDFKECRLTGMILPENNYPLPIESGQVFVIDYTLKDGGIERLLMRCDGDIFEQDGCLNTHACIVDAPLGSDTMIIGGKTYTASYYGERDMSSWSEKYSNRDFWRLEDAYDDFRECRLTGEYLPENNFPMPIEAGKIYVIDYTLKSGGTERKVMRCDGNLWEGMLTTQAISVDAPLHVETMTINGKSYTATYYGQGVTSWSDIYAYRDFWRLEGAYADFKDCRLTSTGVLASNYPMHIEAGQVFVIDYTKKSGDVERQVLRCDGTFYNGELETYVLGIDIPIRTDTITIGDKDYIASYYGERDISNASEIYSCRDFWRLENAYADFKDCLLTGEGVLDRNYPMAIEAGQVFVIDYTRKSGGVVRQILRCDGSYYNGMLETRVLIPD